MNTPPPITPLEFEPDDHAKAQEMAERLGYKQTAYTSTSALWGLFCLNENPSCLPRAAADYLRNKPPLTKGCIIKTKEFGLLFVQDREDLGFDDHAAAAS
jgi:hypothetical protein